MGTASGLSAYRYMVIAVADVVISSVNRGQGKNIREKRGLRGNWNEISKAKDLITVDMRLWAPWRRSLDFFFFFREAKDLSLYMHLPVCNCWKFILIKANNKTVPICGPKKTCP